VQTGSQRTNGFEAGWNGRLVGPWSIAGGYGWQDAYVVRSTASARAGAQVAQVPHQTFSLWNNYRILPRLGAGLGIVNRADMFAAIDNTIVLPAYTRVDAAVYYGITERTRVQVNVENVGGRRYFANADGNNNISPGSGRAVRVGLSTRF
jgi:catecholate siderophore receptor